MFEEEVFWKTLWIQSCHQLLSDQEGEVGVDDEGGSLSWVFNRENPWRSRLESVRVEVEKDQLERVERVVTKQGKINTRRHTVRKQLSLYVLARLLWADLPVFQDHQGSLHFLHPALLVLDFLQPLRGLLSVLAGLRCVLVFNRIISWWDLSTLTLLCQLEIILQETLSLTASVARTTSSVWRTWRTSPPPSSSVWRPSTPSGETAWSWSPMECDDWLILPGTEEGPPPPSVALPSCWCASRAWLGSS